jgi:hypothetical protein
MRMSSAAAQQRPVPLDEQVIAKHGIGGLWCDSRRNRQWSSVAIAAVTNCGGLPQERPMAYSGG